jgi:signal transduction histidine kinase
MDLNAPIRLRSHRSKVPLEFRELLHALLAHASRLDSRSDVLGRFCESLLRFSGCDSVSIRIDEDGSTTRWRACLADNGTSRVETRVPRASKGARPDEHGADPIPEHVVQAILAGSVAAPTSSCSRRGGSFWIGDAARPILLRQPDEQGPPARTVVIGGDFPSVALIPIPVSDRCRGVLFLASRRRDFFSSEDIQMHEAVAQTLGVALAHQGAQWALRERVKELTCLYGIAKVADRPGIQLDEFLAEIVKLLPPGWQYPEISQARVTLDGRSFSTAGFQEGPDCQGADIWVNGIKRGAIQVVYTEKMPDADEGPFLKEERSLIDEVARHVGFTVEHRETEAEASRLQEQLRHAERLATVGQLSAGVAHELNEPLGAILGFAELVNQSSGLPDQAARDVDRIIKAALHAREIIRKLMIFTRQMPTRKAPCDLNQVATEGLDFLASRCAKEGITVVHQLEDALPPVMADPSQMYQVLVNLVVNAIQAMPGGGTLTMTTYSGPGKVFLCVTDTGTGMSPEVQQQLFVPFFSTKDVGQGTGLGLAVVHGIVTAHGGTVTVRSEVGRGSSFEICIPTQGGSSDRR